MKALTFGILVAMVAIGGTGVSAAVSDGPAAEQGSIEIAARPRGTASRSTVRRYRSYSVQPGGVADNPGSSGAAVEPSVEQRTYSAPASSGRGGKPSYMRSDSKARGRYHQ